MAEEDKSQKTEEPTPKKLQDARKDGDVPSSKEVGTVMSVFVLTVAVLFMGPGMAASLHEALGAAFQNATSVEVGDGVAGLKDINVLTQPLLHSTLKAVGPLFLLMVLAAIFGQLVQGDTVIALKRIQPKWEKISPIKGIKRLFSANTLVEFLKSISKVALVIIISTLVVVPTLTGMWKTTLFIPEKIPAFLREKTGIILLIVTCLIVPIAIIDILWKRSEWLKKHRMSLKEVRDEHKDMEGDPHIKSKRAQKRRELSQRRMKDAIPTATVILTNPTHYAVALRYEKGTDLAPVVVGKGIDSLALKIREIAKEHEVPIIENKPLARALHAAVEIDDAIPHEHWAAVADIIGYVMDLKRNIRRRPPEGSELRED